MVQAALFIFLIWAVDKAVTRSRQRQPAFSTVPTAQPRAVGAIPDCSSSIFMRSGERCYTLAYSPAVRGCGGAQQVGCGILMMGGGACSL